MQKNEQADFQAMPSPLCPAGTFESACKPKIARVQALEFDFQKGEKLCWFNEISTFLISQMVLCGLVCEEVNHSTQAPKTVKASNSIRPVQKLVPCKITLAECCGRFCYRLTTLKTWKKHKMYQISLDVWQQMNGLISRRCRRPSAQQKYLGTFGPQRAPKRHCNDLARLKPLLRFSNPICVRDNDLAQSCVAICQNADGAFCQNIFGQVLASNLPKLKFL